MEKPIDKALLRKFLEDQCTPGELETIRQWLQQPVSDEMLHELLTEDWRALAEEYAGEEYPGQDLYDKTRMGLWKESMHRRLAIPLRKRLLPRYAAVWILCLTGMGLLGTWYAGRHQGIPAVAMMKKHNNAGQRSTILLPDSSVIYLGPASTVYFPTTFPGDTREVRLEGQAFFDITHDPAKTFIVRSGDVQTRVLGTSFRVDAFAGRPVTVAVASGKVSVAAILKKGTGGSKVLSVLVPGEKVSWDAVSGIATAGREAVEGLAQWRTGRLTFDHTSLGDIAEQLERQYNVHIRITKASKAQESISGIILPGMPISEAMQILSVTGHFTYKIKEKGIIEIY